MCVSVCLCVCMYVFIHTGTQDLYIITFKFIFYYFDTSCLGLSRMSRERKWLFIFSQMLSDLL